MTGRPDRVSVWAIQLRSRDFPPVCAMSGKPADVWGRFRFVTSPRWAWALHLLAFTGVGLIPVLVISAAVARRARGWLPLTRASRRKLRAVVGTSIALFAGGIAVAIWGLGAILFAPALQGPHVDLGSHLVLIGFAGFVIGGVGLAVVKPRFGPQGHVFVRWERDLGHLVELRNVHPLFVMAVHQVQHERAGLHAPRSGFGQIEVN